MQYYYTYSLLLIFCNIANCAKILGIFPCPGYSHFILGEKLFGELAKRGHEVTVISEFEPNEKIENYVTIKTKKSEPFDNECK